MRAVQSGRQELPRSISLGCTFLRDEEALSILCAKQETARKDRVSGAESGHTKSEIGIVCLERTATNSTLYSAWTPNSCELSLRTPMGSAAYRLAAAFELMILVEPTARFAPKKAGVDHLLE